MREKETLTRPSGFLFILSRTRSKEGFPVVSPRAAIKSALRGSSNAPTAEPTATAACCHGLSLIRAALSIISKTNKSYRTNPIRSLGFRNWDK